MTSPDLTGLTIILDKSGSMIEVRDVTISAFNEYLQGQRAEPGRCDVTLTLFDTRITTPHLEVPIADVPALTSQTYVPGGMTALWDAVGSTIVAVGDHYARRPEEQRPGRVLVVVQTDGYENSSREYTAAKVRDMITHQREVYGWEFLFLGADQDAWLAGQAMGVANTISYDNTREGIGKAYAALSKSTSGYRAGRGVAPGHTDIREDT
jgi:hypothetical protein